MSKVVVFPIAKQSEAEAYAAWTDTHWPGYDAQDPANSRFSYTDEGVNGVRLDRFGQHVAPYLGPDFKWSGVDVEEPAGGEAMRADGVIVTAPEWPET